MTGLKHANIYFMKDIHTKRKRQSLRYMNYAETRQTGRIKKNAFICTHECSERYRAVIQCIILYFYQLMCLADKGRKLQISLCEKCSSPLQILGLYLTPAILECNANHLLQGTICLCMYLSRPTGTVLNRQHSIPKYIA